MKYQNFRYDHLLGRPFVQGKTDCFSIWRDIYRETARIEMFNYARPNDCWLYGMNPYEENYKQEGFVALADIDLKDLEILDVFLIAIPDARNPTKVITNHCAVYVGQGMVIHHPYQRRSVKVPYRGALKNFTVKVLRHPDAPKIELPTKKVDMMDHILPQKRSMIQDAIKNGTPGGRR